MDKAAILAYAADLKGVVGRVVRLYYNKECSQREIAEKLGLSVYRVKGCLARGMYMIRSKVGDPELKKASEIVEKYRHP